MKIPWSVHRVSDIWHDEAWAETDKERGIYARAVAEPYAAGRLRAAWWVLTGRAFALIWPKVGDLETSLHLPFWKRNATSPTGAQA